jgi:hypothetical protein
MLKPSEEEPVGERIQRPPWRSGVLKRVDEEPPMEEEEVPARPKKARAVKKIEAIWGSKRFAFICVDVFSKKVFVEPLAELNAPSAAKGMAQAVLNLGPPKEVYTDDGGEFKGEFSRYLEAQRIDHLVARKHAMFAERFIRYLRWHLKDRQTITKEDWVKLLPNIVNQYNNGNAKRPIHTSTGLTPNEGHDDRNALAVKLGWVMQAKRDRKYPHVSEGDKVKIYQKK